MNEITASKKSSNKRVYVQNKKGFKRKFLESRYLLLLFLPCFIYLVMFKYAPMWGILIAFKNYKLSVGLLHSPWVGFKHFVTFFQNPMALKLIRNTFLLGLYSLLWGFPMPIILALVLNEVRMVKVKRFIQTVSYLPYFISTVVIAGMLREFLSPNGVINQLIRSLGGHTIVFFNYASWFRTIYISSDIWQFVGWGAIIYIAALSNIDTELYNSASIDGCNKFQKIIHIDIPGIAPTIIILFLLNTGSILSVGFEKILLLYNPLLYDTADVISTYMYRAGFTGSPDYGYAAAVGLFQTVVCFAFILMSNTIAKKVSETNLW